MEDTGIGASIGPAPCTLLVIWGGGAIIFGARQSLEKVESCLVGLFLLSLTLRNDLVRSLDVVVFAVVIKEVGCRGIFETSMLSGIEDRGVSVGVDRTGGIISKLFFRDLGFFGEAAEVRTTFSRD